MFEPSVKIARRRKCRRSRKLAQHWCAAGLEQISLDNSRPMICRDGMPICQSVSLIGSLTPNHSTGDFEMPRPWGRCSVARRLETQVMALVTMYDDKDEDNSSSELQGAGRSAVDVVQDAAI